MSRHPPPGSHDVDRPPEGEGDERVLRLFELLGRRWALRVLWELQAGPSGFRALQTRGGGISASVLARRLTELVDAGVLEQDAERRYVLSAGGSALTRILAQLERWAARDVPAEDP